jgi:uncharacterized BrkB/YihY/UPF0761 family membrane protein
MGNEKREGIPLSKAAEFLLDECRMVLWSIGPLALGISVDCYLLSRIIVGSRVVAVLAAALFIFFSTLWYVLPRVRGLQEVIGGR